MARDKPEPRAKKPREELGPEFDRALVLACIEAGESLRKRLLEALAPVGITPEQLELLRHLAAGLSTPRQIIDASGRDKTTLSRAIARAAKAGLVAHQRRDDDRRRQALALTERGLAALRAADRIALEVSPRLVAALGAKQRRRLAKSMGKLAGRPRRP